MSFKGLKETIGNYIKTEDNLRNNYQNYTIGSVWKDVAGVAVDKYTDKIVLKDKKLTIYIASAPLRQEIMYSKVALLDKINAHLPYQKIEEIVVK